MGRHTIPFLDISTYTVTYEMDSTEVTTIIIVFVSNKAIIKCLQKDLTKILIDVYFELRIRNW